MYFKYLKLGFLVVFFVFGSLLALTWINGNPLLPKKHYFFLFKNVQGISVGSKVRYSGLPCGKVVGFALPENQKQGILVKAEITNPKVKIYKNDLVYSIPNSTIASEYEISIEPNRLDPRKTILKEGEVLLGGDSLTINEASEEAVKLLQKITTVAEQIEKISVRVNQYVSSIEPVFRELENLSKNKKISETVDNLNYLSRDAKNFWIQNKTEFSSTLKRVDSIASQAEKKINLVEDSQIASILYDIKRTTSKVNQLVSFIEVEDLKKLKQVSKQVNTILTKIQSKDPNRDLPTLILKTSQNTFYVTEQLEENLKKLKGKTILGSLLTKVK